MKFPRGPSFTNLDDPESFTSPPRRRKLDFHHPATHISPYGSHVGEALRFQHTPGSDMRIATRRPDGAWQFSDPSSPFTPSGVSELDSSPKRSYKSSLPKKTKSTLLHNTQFDYAGHYDFVIDPPPPAYGYDYSGHFPPQKS
ncbi:hypothetical protein H0H93_008086 [Arthromyces matolae]|nr:hypothetical protein H0H93_008086 [Arthromyces matolae]